MKREDQIKIYSILLILVPTGIFGIIGNSGEMLIALFGGFTSSVLLNLDKFESFKAGQLEAKLQKAEQIIDDANATIQQLTSVTTPLLKSNLSFLLYEGIFDGMSSNEKEKVFYALLKIKDSLDLSESEGYFIEAAEAIASDYFQKIFQEINDVNDDFRIKYSKYTTVDYIHESPNISEIELFLMRIQTF